MSDNLRGAVAEVAMHFLSDREIAWLTQDQSLALADAVIRELKLKRDTSTWVDHGPGCEDPPPIDVHRYVTDWTADE